MFIRDRAGVRGLLPFGTSPLTLPSLRDGPRPLLQGERGKIAEG
jgi:hypothetical protein